MNGRHCPGVRGVVCIALLLLCRELPAAPPTTAASRPAASRFMRLVETPAASRLESAIVTYQNRDGAKVSLVAVVHIGEKDYYAALSKAFERHDAVLYEMIKPKDAAAPTTATAGGSNHPIARLQRLLRDILGLEYQLDRIDYSRPNFVHADLDAEAFAKLQGERGESLPALMLRAIMRAMRNPDANRAGQMSDLMDEMSDMLTKPDMERRLRRILARSMGDVEATAAAFGGDTVILTERNKAAIAVLKQTLDKGKKNVAIFYGAAHMPDLAARLEAMGFKETGCEYVAAWDLTIRPDAPSAMDKLLKGVLKMLEPGDDGRP